MIIFISFLWKLLTVEGFIAGREASYCVNSKVQGQQMNDSTWRLLFLETESLILSFVMTGYWHWKSWADLFICIILFATELQGRLWPAAQSTLLVWTSKGSSWTSKYLGTCCGLWEETERKTFSCSETNSTKISDCKKSPLPSLLLINGSTLIWKLERRVWRRKVWNRGIYLGVEKPQWSAGRHNWHERISLFLRNHFT